VNSAKSIRRLHDGEFYTNYDHVDVVHACEGWIMIDEKLATILQFRKKKISKSIYCLTYRNITLNQFWIRPKWPSMNQQNFEIARHFFYSGPMRTSGVDGILEEYVASYERVWELSEDEYENLSMMIGVKAL
jgi:hypothetical protein